MSLVPSWYGASEFKKAYKDLEKNKVGPALNDSKNESMDEVNLIGDKP